MKTFQKSTFIKCNIEDLFNFHLDLNNLKAITPKDTTVELISSQTPKEGAILKMKAVKNYLPTLWEVKIEKLKFPSLLVDKALRSPFKFWEHSHVFIQREEYCELKDIVKFELPLGWFGKLFENFIYRDLNKMFLHRHKVTKDLLELKM